MKNYIIADGARSIWGIKNEENFAINIPLKLEEKSSKAKYIKHQVLVKKKVKKVLVTLQCSCGNYFNVDLNTVFGKGVLLCKDCLKDFRKKHKRAKSQRKNKEQIIQEILSYGYQILSLPENFTYSKYVEVEDGEGYKGFIRPNRLKEGVKLSKFDVRINKKHYIENVNNLCSKNNFKATCIGFCDEDNWTRQGLKFICECGNEFVTSISSFQNGKTRCEHCASSISRYEYTFKNYLDKEGYSYIYQYSLNQCRDILPLPFDFYLTQYHAIIEIDGEGHFHPCHFNQIGYEDSIKTFEITKKHDGIKNKYCEEHNISLLRIPYTAIQDNTYPQFFQKFIRELTNSN